MVFLVYPFENRGKHWMDKQKLLKGAIILIGMVILIGLLRLVHNLNSKTLMDYAKEHPEALEQVEKIDVNEQ